MPTTRGYTGRAKVPPYSLKARLGLMRGALAGVHCDHVMSKYSGTLLRKPCPRRRWARHFDRCHRTLCWGWGLRPATRNHPRSYNAHAMGTHPSSLIVGWARRPSRLHPTVPFAGLPRGVKKGRGESPLRAPSGLCATSTT